MTLAWTCRIRSAVVVGAIAAAFLVGCARKEASDSVRSAGRVAPPIVLDMIAAHGGMDAWRAAPTVAFEDEFVTPGSPPSVSRVMVEQGRRRGYIEYPGTGAIAAWDGDSCWSKGWNLPFPPRFAMLLNYYFLNLPWLTQDPGVKFAEQGTSRLLSDSTEYATVLMTFEQGTGDTPNDYYRLHIDPVTKRLKACKYIVTYRAILPKGVSSSPENTLVIDFYDTVKGLVVPVKYTIYGPNQQAVTTCLIRNWAFDRPFDESRLKMVPGAVVDRSNP